jgi:signal transduction histidine kinase
MVSPKNLDQLLGKKNRRRPEKIIKGVDAVSVSLLKQIYSGLYDRGENRTLIEKVWINQIESIYSDKEAYNDYFLSGLVTLLNEAYELLASDKKPWNVKRDQILALAEKIIFLKGREDTFKTFFDDLEQVMFRAIQLDFSERVNLVSVGNSKENIFNYKAAITNTLLDTLETSVISSHAIDDLISQITGVVAIVTSQRGKIKFINTLGLNTLTGKDDSVLKQHVSKILPHYKEISKEFQEQGIIRNKKFDLKLGVDKSISFPAVINVFKSKTQSTVEEIIYLIRVQQFETSLSELDLKQQLHDRIAPINNLLGGLQVISKKLIDKESQELVKEMIKAADNLRERNIRDLKDQVSSGLIRPEELEMVEVEPLIDEIITETGLLQKQEGCKIIKDISVPSFLTKSSLFRSIAHNLISNAFKFRDKNRKLELTVSFTFSNKGLLFQVIDNGIGIKKSRIPKLFSASTKPKITSEGAGLGLSIVREYAKKLNGGIGVQSKYGEGTTFSVFLPHIVIK